MALELLRGTIKHYKCKRDYATFVFNDKDKTAFGAIAIAAGLAGLSGQAIGTASAAASMEEAADYLEFELDGKSVKGWVWCSPFQEGEAVEVVGEWKVGHFEAYAVARPEDRIVALYPHCSRGAKRHVNTAVKWWFWGNSFMMLLVLLMVGYLGLSSTLEKFLMFLPIALGGGLYSFTASSV